ncbi:endospore coat-associated protein [Paenibacillus sp. Leaf72]|nr:endospore coat-associated protein [Paenibacillus sp. Leaf72]
MGSGSDLKKGESSLSIQRVTSKWAKTQVLLRSEHLRQYMPATELFSKENLLAMLTEYSMVYVKPVNGTFGKGVIRVEQYAAPGRGFRYQIETSVRTFATFDQLYNSLYRYQVGKRYLIQRGIFLLRHQKRRFDIRVMVQKNPQASWEATGIIGRLAHPAKIVTNYHSGGTPMPFEQLMNGHLSTSEQQAYRQRLNKLSLSIVHQMLQAYPRIKEIGVDIAIDTKLRPWILEVNTCPDPFIFRKLPDKSVFKKIYRYAVAYGRYKRK